ncbi:MAG: L-threonylcarbamoyladenylate synthase [Candidatus Micrarchaeia archaeon]
MTKIFRINKIDENAIKKIKIVADGIKKGKIAIFPTETVYGIGVSAFDKKSIKRLYKIKERSHKIPLTVHVCDLKQVYEIVEFDERTKRIFEKLTRKFWPGPLTLILKKKKGKVPDEATAGLDTVAVRMPRNKIALELIKEAGPLVAPSANVSGKPSGTTIKDIIEDFSGKVEFIIDGGPSEIGLESTVLDLTQNVPTILRPGGISYEQLKKLIKVKIGGKKEEEKEEIKYSPKADVVILFGKGEKIKEFLRKEREKKKKIGAILISKINVKGIKIKKVKSLKEYARNLFKYFRDFDRKKIKTIYCEAVEEKGIGYAIMDRIKKAAKNKIKITN